MHKPIIMATDSKGRKSYRHYSVTPKANLAASENGMSSSDIMLQNLGVLESIEGSVASATRSKIIGSSPEKCDSQVHSANPSSTQLNLVPVPLNTVRNQNQTVDCHSKQETSTWHRPIANKSLVHSGMCVKRVQAKKKPEAILAKCSQQSKESVSLKTDSSVTKARPDVARRKSSSLENKTSVSKCKLSLSRTRSAATTPACSLFKEYASPNIKLTIARDVSEIFTREPQVVSSKFSQRSQEICSNLSRQQLPSTKEKAKMKKSRIPRLSKHLSRNKSTITAKVKSRKSNHIVQGSSPLKRSPSATRLVSPKIKIQSDEDETSKQQKKVAANKRILNDEAGVFQNDTCANRSPHTVCASKCSLLYSEMSDFKLSAGNGVDYRNFVEKGNGGNQRRNIPHGCVNTGCVTKINHCLSNTKEFNISPDEYETISLSSSIAKILQSRIESQESFCSKGYEHDVSPTVFSPEKFSSSCKDKSKKTSNKYPQYRCSLSDDGESICAPDISNRRSSAPPRQPVLDATGRLRELITQRPSSSVAVRDRVQLFNQPVMIEENESGVKTGSVKRHLQEYQLQRPLGNLNSVHSLSSGPDRQNAKQVNHFGQPMKGIDTAILSGSTCVKQLHSKPYFKENSPARQTQPLVTALSGTNEEALPVLASAEIQHDFRNKLYGCQKQFEMEISDPAVMLNMSTDVSLKKRLGKMSPAEVKAICAYNREKKRPKCRRTYSTSVSASLDAFSAKESVNGISNITLPHEEKTIALTPSHFIPRRAISPARSAGSPKLYKGEGTEKTSNLSVGFDRLLSVDEESGYYNKVMSIKHWLETTSLSKLSVLGSDCTNQKEYGSNMVSSSKAERSSISTETKLYRESRQSSPTKDCCHVLNKPSTQQKRDSSEWQLERNASFSCSPKVSSRVRASLKTVKQGGQNSLMASRWPLVDEPQTTKRSVGKLGQGENQLSLSASPERGSPKNVAALTAAGYRPYSRKQPKTLHRQTLWVRCILTLCVLLVTFELVVVAYLWHKNMLPRMPVWLTAGGEANFEILSNNQDDSLPDKEVEKPSEEM